MVDSSVSDRDPSAVAAQRLEGGTLTIQTPENVALDLPLAGLGSRFAALLIDALLLLVTLLVMLFVTAMFGGLGVPESVVGIVLTLAVPLLLWGWFFYFEAFQDGRTPGKRALGLRAVEAGGRPLSVTSAAVRNLVRVIDLQPGVTCLVGGTCMALDSRSRRLGDLAAGTLVVRELPAEFPELPEIEHEALGAPRLPGAAYAALEDFASRRGELERAAAEAIGARMLAALVEAGHAEPGRGSAQTVLEFYEEEQRRRAAARLGAGLGSAAAVDQLRAKRKRWVELQDRVDDSGAPRTETEVAELAGDLREISSDLARARTFGAAPAVVWSLERLTARVHARFYRGAAGLGRRALQFVTGGFPQLVRHAWKPIALASVLLYLPALIVYLVVDLNPSLELALAGDEMVRRAEVAAAQPGSDYRDTWGGMFMGSDVLSAMLIANNVQVALFAFASGATLGFLTLYLMVSNGVHLGSTLAVFANRGAIENIGLFIAPHGAIELTAIAIAGGAGLHLASGFWLPGRRRRLAVIAERAREGAALVAGVIVMLLVAGLIEGFVSPARLPGAVKVAVASAALCALVGYLALVGRDRAADLA